MIPSARLLTRRLPLLRPLLFTFAVFSALRLAALPAFPGAEGFGANATGGRGGTVYHVTNLNDSGAGSFRDAVSQPNRYIVFDVGGVIKISSRIVVKNNLTIAGQTAPGEGITIYGNGFSFSGASNTITRYIRIRMGVGGDSGKDALGIANGHDMIFDHVTVSWGRDETFSINADDTANPPSNITLQDCMIAMGLQTHSAGGLMQTDGGVSIIRTLYIDNHTRNAKVKGVNEFINCVVYNWGGGGGYILGDSAGQSYANISNNYFVSGPNTTIAPFTRGNLNFHVYAVNNFHDANRNGVLDGADVPPSGYTTVDFQPVRYPYPTVSKLLTPQEAFAHVAANAGASKKRDRVDLRYIDELNSLGTLGQIPTNENDAPISGPFPVAGGSAPVDTDGDGMPDAWERAVGTNPNVADHNGDINGDGYTNLEEYLNSLAPAGVQRVAITGITTDTGSSTGDAITSDSTIVLNGTAEAGATVTLTRIGTGVIGTTTANASGAWSFDYTGTALPQGAHPFTATGTLGGWTTPPTPAFIVTVDNTAPAAPQITSITVSGGNLVFNGSAEAGASLKVTRVGSGTVGAATADSAGLWSAPYSGPALAPGIYSFTATAQDLAGNAGPASAPYVVDTSVAPPAFTSITTDSGALANDRITNDTTLVLNGTGTAGHTVAITRAGVGVIGSAVVAAGGTWSFNYTATTLPAGTHTFSAVASTGGTSSPSSSPFVVTIDTTAAVVSSIVRLNPTSAATTASSVMWRVTFSEPVNGVDVADFTLTASGASAALASVVASGTTSFDVTAGGVSGDGTLRLDLKSSGTGIVDVAGNAMGTGFTSGQSYTIRLPGSGVWISTDSGDLWSDPFSWENGVIASGGGATADFATIDPDTSLTVQLDSPRTLGRLIFGDTDASTAASWTVDVNGSAANQLTLVAASGAPALVVNALGSGATANLDVGLNSTTGLAKSGAGTAVLLGNNAISGPLSVSAGILRVGLGGNLSSSTVAIASGGAQLNVAGGSYDASGLVTITAGSSSGILVSSGVGNFNGGITSTNARDALVRVTGGTLNASFLDFPRTNDSSINFGVGLVVTGGAANFGTIVLGSNNSWGTASFEGGVTTVSGAFTVGRQVTQDRGGQIRVTNGTLIVNDAVDGLVLVRNPGTQPRQVASATFSGGTALLEKITLGYDASSTAGSATITVNGGALYVGSGGVVKNGTLSTPVNLTSGTLGARSDWSTVVPLALPSGNSIVIKAADAGNNAHDITLNGALTGVGGFTKTGAGALTLAAANTFSGSASLNAGTLRVTGSLASGGTLNLNGGTLAGTGTINRPVVLNAATIAPDGTNALTLGGNALTWNGGGQVALALGASGASGSVAISGALTKGSAGGFTFAFAPGVGFAAGNTYTVATFASTDFTAADFSAIGLPAGYAASFAVTTTSVQVTIVGTPFITSPATATGTFGAPFSYTIGAGNVPTSFSAVGLPPGLSLDSTTGVIAGTPTAAGTFNVTIGASNIAGTGTAPLAISIAKASATIALSDLVHAYDGQPHGANAATTPAGLMVTFTYDGNGAAPTLPGSYAVVATIVDANYAGTASDTLVITITALVRHAPALSGDLEGSLQVVSAESVTLNGGALIAGDLLVPGTPTIVLNGSPTYASTLTGPGAASPAGQVVTLNGSAVLRHVVTRVDPLALSGIAAPLAPPTTRDATINRPGDSAGDFATLRNLTLNGNAGAVAVPAGRYGAWVVNSGALVLGVNGATEPAVYELQTLTLNGSARIDVVGPVIVTVKSGVATSGTLGDATHPEWLTLRIANGGLTLQGNAALSGLVFAPSGNVAVNGSAQLKGRVVADQLTLNGGLLRDPAAAP